jgi:TolB protein
MVGRAIQSSVDSASNHHAPHHRQAFQKDRCMSDIRQTPLYIGRRFLVAGSAALLAGPAFPQGAFAQAAANASAGSAVIDVSRARTAPIPIALPSFASSDPQGAQIGADIARVISSDLANCGLFRPINPAAFIGGAGSPTGSPATGSEVPAWQNWSVLGAQALVTGRVESQGSQVRLEFRLWDVLPQQQIQGTAYTAAVGSWRRIAHIISDVIYERLLGEKGYFDTRVVYVAGTGPRDRRTRRLAIMDQDGENHRYLTDGSWMVLTPRFNPARDQITYMSYAGNKPRVYLFDIDSGRQQMLGDFDGMTFSPRFSPNGGSVVMSVARGSGSDLVAVDLASHTPRRLTTSGAIDVSPCYSPDGSQIVFNSDRGGDQQLYVMDAGGGNVRRISYGAGRYGTPVWSPRGDLIAFTRIGETFAIGVMHPDGSGERILSESFDVEGPTFCPNGRVLMFWRTSPARDARGGGYGSRLVSIDVTGFNERVVPTPTDASDPAWSPLNG